MRTPYEDPHRYVHICMLYGDYKHLITLTIRMRTVIPISVRPLHPPPLLGGSRGGGLGEGGLSPPHDTKVAFF